MDRINDPYLIGQQVGGIYSLIVALLSDSYRRRSDCTVLFVVVTRGPPRFPVPDRYCCILKHVSRRQDQAGHSERTRLCHRWQQCRQMSTGHPDYQGRQPKQGLLFNVFLAPASTNI